MYACVDPPDMIRWRARYCMSTAWLTEGAQSNAWSAIAIIVSVNKISGFLLLLLFYYVMKSSSSTLSVHLTDIECESEPAAAAAARLTATRHVPSLYPRHRMMSSSHIRLLLQKHEVYLCCYPAMTGHQLIHRLITITLLH